MTAVASLALVLAIPAQPALAVAECETALPCAFIKSAEASVNVVEGHSGSRQATFQIHLDQPSSQTVNVWYRTRDAWAEYGSDYAFTWTYTTFQPGQIVKSVSIPIYGDIEDEAHEDFYVDLMGANNALVWGGTAHIRILNDDLLLTVNNTSVVEGDSGTKSIHYTVSLSRRPHNHDVTVQYATVEGTADSGIDYVHKSGTLTFPKETWDLTHTVSVSVKGDTAIEPNETVLLNLSNPVLARFGDSQGVGTITDNDTFTCPPQLPDCVEP
jgi:hypothetical protein